MGAGETLGGNLTVWAGTFDVNDQTLNINGTTTVNGSAVSAVMKTGTGVVTFGDGSGTDDVLVNDADDELQIESDDTINEALPFASAKWNDFSVSEYQSVMTIPQLGNAPQVGRTQASIDISLVNVKLGSLGMATSSSTPSKLYAGPILPLAQ